MKIGGVEVTAPCRECLVLPRQAGAEIVFWAEALQDMDEFNELCPVPKPPGKLTKDGFIPDNNDSGYIQVMTNHVRQRMAYMIIKSLEPSVIEWDTVKADNPKTWVNWEADMEKAKLTKIEIQRVVQLVTDANGLNEEKIERAREDFLLGRVLAQSESFTQATGQDSTQSGEPAPASA